ncbi:MAG: flagellar biosynthesis protein FlgA [Chloroflexi bacterium]|nr:MAG: flagellar biosynthesis protein FlgA [Chloroflexota bacterium]MBL1195482.1 flagellar biosynthesis protein FlgA [Chloroflexota bacterium]NOH12764.1 Gfo/Idh/MocA family oxidoreductase [Chloroflexota bacterium]
MASLRERLEQNELDHGPVRVGLVGAGQMGTGLISQIEKMAGIKVVAVADVLPGRSKDAFIESSVKSEDVHETDDVDAATKLVQEGQRVATVSSDFLVEIDALDVIVEATGVPEVGARVCQAAIKAGKHIVNMNVEADATIGYYFASMAKEAGVVYSLAAGDEPGSIKELYDFADALGFEIITIGKGKNNPLDRSATPDHVAEKAKAQNMSAKMLASFVDGTKTMVEMTSIGNATGFAPEVRGAYGPNAKVDDLPKTFVPKAAGGIFDNPGAVDYAVGVAPGVFIIITTDQPKIINDLNYLGLLGHGNYWALYRPYHLANLETPITIASVALDQRETLLTKLPPVAETLTIAKRDLKSGEQIDGLGGYTAYGMIDRADVAREGNLLPLGLAVGATLVRDVPLGTAISYDDVELKDDQLIVQLRREQDELLSNLAKA